MLYLSTAHPWPLAKKLRYISSVPLAIGAHCPTVRQKTYPAVPVEELAKGLHAKVHVGWAAPYIEMRPQALGIQVLGSKQPLSQSLHPLS